MLAWAGLCFVFSFLFMLFHASFPIALCRCQSQKLNRRPSFPTAEAGEIWSQPTQMPRQTSSLPFFPTDGRKAEGRYGPFTGLCLSFPGELIQRDQAQGLSFARRENKPKQMKIGFSSPNTLYRNTATSTPDSRMLHSQSRSRVLLQLFQYCSHNTLQVYLKISVPLLYEFFFLKVKKNNK